MNSVWGRVAGSIVAVSAGLALTACMPQIPAQQPSSAPVVNGGQAGDQGGTDADEPGDGGGQSGKQNKKKTGPQMSKDLFVTTYTGSSSTALVQRPKDFVPSSVAGTGPANIEMHQMHWARWDKDRAVGNAVATVTGGGADPETIKGVRVILSQPKVVNGKQQYTFYRAEFPDGVVNERALEFPGS